LPWLLPWQPNGSGNGRILDMILTTFVFENRDSLCLFYGVPDAWFASKAPMGVSDLHTLFGRISFQLTPDHLPGKWRFRYTCEGRAPGAFLLAIPSSEGKEARKIVTIPSDGRLTGEHVVP
jgi:hypothetical protein